MRNLQKFVLVFSLCIFQYLTLYYIINIIYAWIYSITQTVCLQYTNTTDVTMYVTKEHFQ
jgi:hypothetical protein